MALSKSKLLSFAQCPRRVWLETYSPELEAEPTAEKTALLATGNTVGAIARQLYGRGAGHLVSFERGLRAAIDATRALLAAGGNEPIFEATFDYDGVSVRIDVLDCSEAAPRLIEVKASSRVKEHHLHDCAIQAWALTELGLAPRQIVVATIDSEFVYPGDGRYEGLLIETDVTAAVLDLLPEVRRLVTETRATLASLDEPSTAVGTHCGTPHGCEFYEHCGPPAEPYPVLSLGGSKEKLFELLHAGYADLRNVPEELLQNDTQRRIWRQSRAAVPHIGAELREFVRALPYPRYYLDFETIATAVPLFAGTRPFEALPFQWSCHVETSPGTLQHAEFLDLGGELPLRAAAESLLAALGDNGPIVVYSGYERRVLNELAERCADLAGPLQALAARIVDLLPPTKKYYYHPAMQGSWSLKAVLPTVAPDLAYDGLGEVRDGLAAQNAYVEAIATDTAPPRRAALRQALLDYCRQDTLALARLVEFFGRAA